MKVRKLIACAEEEPISGNNAPDGNAGVVKYFGYYDITSDRKGTEQTLIFRSDLYGGSWTQSSAEIAPIIEAALDEYRR